MMREISEQICWMEVLGFSTVAYSTESGVVQHVTRARLKAMCVTLRHTITEIGQLKLELTEVVSVESAELSMPLEKIDSDFDGEVDVDPTTDALLNLIDAEAAHLLAEAEDDDDPTINEYRESLEADMAYALGLETPRVSDAEEALTLLLSRTH